MTNLCIQPLLLCTASPSLQRQYSQVSHFCMQPLYTCGYVIQRPYFVSRDSENQDFRISCGRYRTSVKVATRGFYSLLVRIIIAVRVILFLPCNKFRHESTYIPCCVHSLARRVLLPIWEERNGQLCTPRPFPPAQYKKLYSHCLLCAHHTKIAQPLLAVRPSYDGMSRWLYCCNCCSDACDIAFIERNHHLVCVGASLYAH